MTDVSTQTNNIREIKKNNNRLSITNKLHASVCVQYNSYPYEISEYTNQ